MPTARDDRTDSRQARRRRLTRQALIAATRELISEKDVSEVRISEITTRADVALGSFYNHFTAKEDAVEAVVAVTLRSVATDIMGAALRIPDPLEAVAVAQRRFIELAWTEPATARLLVHLDRAHALFETALAPHLREGVSRGVSAGVFRGRGLDVTIIATVGATLAIMRAIIDGRVGREAAAHSAEHLLLALGVDPRTAAEVAGRPLTGTAEAMS
ncbi:MAG TPA: helix-turn-helix domain-containing protein [Pseudonocardia sp.]